MLETNNSKSFNDEAQEFDEMGKDPKLNDILSRLNKRQTNEVLLLQNQGDEDGPNFKNYISKNYLQKDKGLNIIKKQNIFSDSARPLKDEKDDGDDEENQTLNENIHNVKVLLDPDEEQKIEEHIKQFKVNSVQQYSILRHYFLNWHEICQQKRDLENNKYKKGVNVTSNISLLKNITPGKEDTIEMKLKKEQKAASPSKVRKEGIEPKSLEKKLLPSASAKKKKKNARVTKDGDVIHKISKSDILKFIPFCNDVILPKKK